MAFGYTILGFGSGGSAFSPYDADYLIVAGGGAAGPTPGGGGGAGGYRSSFPRGTKGPKRKKMVIEAVIEKEKTAFKYEMARGGKNYKKGTDDRADAVVIARAGDFDLRNKDNKGFLTEKIVLVE